MILARFDAVVFLGDDLAQQVYKGLNILLRENMALGALKQWEMSKDDLNGCRCENQFIKPECHKFAVQSSEEVLKNDGSSSHQSSYFCNGQSTSFLSFSSNMMSRNAAPLPPRHVLSHVRQLLRISVCTPRSFSRFLQADPNHSHPVPVHLSFLAHNNLLHGRAHRSYREPSHTIVSDSLPRPRGRWPS